MSNQYIRSTDGTLNIFTNGKSYTINTDHVCYGKVLELVRSVDFNNSSFASKLDSLLNYQKSIMEFSDGVVKVDLANAKVWYNNTEFNDEGLCRRILDFMREGQDFSHLIKFLHNMCKNPSYHSVTQLFKFLSKKGFPLTNNGTFLAYKGVSHEYKDLWTHSVDNNVGSVVELPRFQVCDDHDKPCAAGLHAGTAGYALQYCSGRGRVVLVEVNPADVVSVPNCETEKLRCCRYKVVADHNGGILSGCVYDAVSGKRIEPTDIYPVYAKVENTWDEDHTYGNYEESYDSNDEDEDEDDEEDE